ncbi:MAG: hypothetical protein AAF456_06170 [Planctomycetota bacterium]
MTYSPLAPNSVHNLFSGRIEALGGKILSSHTGDACLYARSTMPLAENLQAGDRVNGGVAIRMLDHEVQVSPFVFRQICRNGAIMSRELGSCEISVDPLDPGKTQEEVLEAIDACVRPEVFENNVSNIRGTIGRPVDAGLALMVLENRWQLGDLTRRIWHRLVRDRDRSKFGLMNAITSIARDEKDPEVKWKLELLGGRIPTMPLPDLKIESEPSSAELQRKPAASRG